MTSVERLSHKRTSKDTRARRSLRTAGFFAGIGGLELGLERAGHSTVQLCEIDPIAQQVLKSRFPDVPLFGDILGVKSVSADSELLSAGFPCQDLSQAGMTLGMHGSRSSLVGEIFRLIQRTNVPWVLLENVPFMLRLAKGEALAVVVDAFERLNYRWAYRVINSQAFGLPQRRERVYILASKAEDPRDVLLSKDAGVPEVQLGHAGVACGFYWTEGTGGLGWAVDAIPTLKNGSTVGIASPPAIWLPSGDLIKPGIRDAERMQGFPSDWTRPAEQIAKAAMRWKLVGNAVTVDVAEWIGKQLVKPGVYRNADQDRPVDPKRTWPRAAYNVGEGRFISTASSYPVRRKSKSLSAFLTMNEASPLSLRAVSGFLSRFERSSLRKPEGFIEAVRAYKSRMEESVRISR